VPQQGRRGHVAAATIAANIDDQDARPVRFDSDEHGFHGVLEVRLGVQAVDNEIKDPCSRCGGAIDR
jgi:hypothetical protein